MTVVVGEESLSGSFIAMEPLYERLLQQKFVTSNEAIEFCREACLEYGFTVKHETGANRSIYIYCSREGLPDANNRQQTTTLLLRKRPSSLKNCDCRWRVVLSENEFSEWTFRKSLNPNASEHNHEITATVNSNDVWPQEVIDKIIQLARQKTAGTTDEIRETIKLQFPDITWNDRRFCNYLTEERKRQKQRGVTERVQRLIMASTRLCSVVAANEDWASCVEGDLSKMLESYRQMTRVSNQSLDTMVDLQLDMIHSEIDKSRRHPPKDEGELLGISSKKRKAGGGGGGDGNMMEGVQVMSIPSCTLFIRSQPLRSLSEPSSQNRRAFNDLISSSPNQQQQQQQLNTTPFGVSSVFTLTSPISSPSSTSSIQQRIDYGNNAYNNRSNDMLQSPPIPDSAGGMIISPNYNSGGSGNNNGGNHNGSHHPHHQHHSPSNNNYNASIYPIQTSFSPYPAQPPQQQQQQQQQATSNNNNFTTGATGTGDVNFSFEPNATSYGQQQHLPPSPAPILIHRNNNSNERLTYNSTAAMGYYTSSANNSMVRESSPSSNSLQQRIMLQQEYEQHQRHLQQIDSSSTGSNGGGVHLPIIRSSTGNNLITTAIVQQQQQHHHHHHHSNINPNQPQQNWS